MTEATTKSRTPWQKILCIAGWKIRMTERVLQPLALLVVRVLVALEFWRSGMTKYNSEDNGLFLFENEYIPNWESNATQNLLGVEITFPVPSAEFAACAATYSELALAALWMIGLCGRGAAFMLFGMALVIETCVYPGTQQHAYWMMIFALLVVTGPGALSIDHVIRRKVLEKKPVCGFCATKTESGEPDETDDSNPGDSTTADSEIPEKDENDRRGGA